MEPNRKVRKQGLEHFIKVVREMPVPSPQAMFQALEEHGYRGQDEARRALCLMAYRHVRRVKRIYVDGIDRAELPRKSNFLCVGPTGSGKTFLVETLFGKILKLPTALVDITTYSETGYVGQDPSTILTRPLHPADQNPMPPPDGHVRPAAFDKSAPGQNNAIFAGAGTTKDVTGMGVQRELLKMLEASDVVVPLDLTHSSYADHVVMSTADIAFIAAGAFSGFQQIAHRRAMRDQIGFGRDQVDGNRDAEAIAVGFTAEQVENIANFQAYGFLPELVARFTRMVPFAALDAGTLKDILRADVVQRVTREFKLEGFDLVIEEPVLDHVVGDRGRPHWRGARSAGGPGGAACRPR